MAARGIDIPELSHVFLYEPPEDHESYIHRAGRTGRAGAAGTVISLVDVMQRMELDRIAKHYKIGLIPMALPTDEDVALVAGTRLTAILEGRFRNLTGLEKVRVARYAALARELAAENDEEASVLLLAMLLDAAHQESLRENRFPDQSSGAAGQQGRSGSGGGSGRSGRGSRSGNASRGSSVERKEEDSAEGGSRSGKRRRRSSRRRDGGEQGRDAAPTNAAGKTDTAE